MKYDIYEGKREQIGESGKLFLSRVNEAQVKGFCKRRGISSADFLNGDFITVDNDHGFWLEEAM